MRQQAFDTTSGMETLAGYASARGAKAIAYSYLISTGEAPEKIALRGLCRRYDVDLETIQPTLDAIFLPAQIAELEQLYTTRIALSSINDPQGWWEAYRSEMRAMIAMAPVPDRSGRTGPETRGSTDRGADQRFRDDQTRAGLPDPTDREAGDVHHPRGPGCRHHCQKC